MILRTGVDRLINVTDYWFIEVVTLSEIDFGFTDGWDFDWFLGGLYCKKSVLYEIVHWLDDAEPLLYYFMLLKVTGKWLFDRNTLTALLFIVCTVTVTVHCYWYFSPCIRWTIGLYRVLRSNNLVLVTFSNMNNTVIV